MCDTVMKSNANNILIHIHLKDESTSERKVDRVSVREKNIYK